MEKEKKKNHKVLKCILTTLIIVLIFAAIGATSFFTYKNVRVLSADNVKIRHQEFISISEDLPYGYTYLYYVKNGDEYQITTTISKISKYVTMEYDIEAQDGIKILSIQDSDKDYVTLKNNHVKIDLRKCASEYSEYDKTSTCHFAYNVKLIDMTKGRFRLTNIRLVDKYNNKYVRKDKEYNPDYGGGELFVSDYGWYTMERPDGEGWKSTNVFFDRGYKLVSYQHSSDNKVLMYHYGAYELYDISNKNKDGKPKLLYTFEIDPMTTLPLEVIWIYDYSENDSKTLFSPEYSKDIYDLSNGKKISYDGLGYLDYDHWHGRNLTTHGILHLTKENYVHYGQKYEGPYYEKEDGWDIDLSTGYHYYRQVGHTYELLDDNYGYVDIDNSKYEIIEFLNDTTIKEANSNKKYTDVFIYDKNNHNIYSIDTKAKLLKNYNEINIREFNVKYGFIGITEEDYNGVDSMLGQHESSFVYCNVDLDAEDVFASATPANTRTDFMIIQSDLLKPGKYLFKLVPGTNTYSLYKVQKQ